MSVGGFDIELNGVKYDLSESAEGDTFHHLGTPLRPPNAVTVQGENPQRFQMRPDVLLWSLTDWSGGEGQIKFDPLAPNRWRALNAVRVFQEPGTLQPGWNLTEADDGIGSDFAVAARLAPVGETAYAMADSTNTYYELDPTNLEVANPATVSGAGSGAEGVMDGDADEFWFIETSTFDIFGSTQGQISTTPTSHGDVAALGPYVYVNAVSEAKVYEVAKNGSGTTTVDDYSEAGSGLADGDGSIVALDGSIFVMVPRGQSTVIRKIRPSSAAGTGFGREIARIHGFLGEIMWAHQGTIYMVGSRPTRDNATVEERSLMYLDPNGSYGSLGRLRDMARQAGFYGYYGAGDMLSTYFITKDDPDGNGRVTVWEIDAVSGGFSQVAIDEVGDATSIVSITGALMFKGYLWVGVEDNANSRMYIFIPENYAINSSAISPWHDFDVAATKILASVDMACEDLPADWTVYVDYAIDRKDTWTTAITYSTENGNGIKTQISTDTSTITFSELSIRIRMEYTGVGIPTSGPKIMGIDVRTQVAEPLQGWVLTLDLSDDVSRHGGSSGTKKKANVVTAGTSKQVVDFKDGYSSRTPGEFTAYDVVVDQWDIVLSQPGEGYAQVRLLEVA